MSIFYSENCVCYEVIRIKMVEPDRPEVKQNCDLHAD
jgi:hypothetical protein